MMINGLLVKGYRGFTQEVTIENCAKINVFIGKNNSGKSNVLRFIHFLQHVKGIKSINSNNKVIVGEHDFLGQKIEYGFQVNHEAISDDTHKIHASKIISIIAEDNSLWIRYQMDKKGAVSHDLDSLKALLCEKLDNDSSNSLLRECLGRYGGNHEGRCSELAGFIAQSFNFDYKNLYIPEIREIRSGANGKGHHDGGDLISRLRRIQNPTLENRETSIKIYSKINKFLADILGEADARYEVPSEREEIYVTIDGKTLPLANLGMGITELVIMAAAATTTHDTVLCIDEPELHLHPELQKKFIQYLDAETDNQYFIATHSNALLDYQNTNVYSTKLVSGNTIVEMLKSRKSKTDVLADLGYRASDFFQSNCVIWVEGPSDRVYIKKWIESKSKYIEGTHYSLMFYGGSLLKHLSYDSPLEDFVALSRINHNSIIVIDSDKADAEADISEVKKRVKSEFEANGAHVWITAGRSIENYLPKDRLVAVIEKMCPKSKRECDWGAWVPLTSLCQSPEKVAIAKNIVVGESDYSVLDLDTQISAVLKVIGEANR